MSVQEIMQEGLKQKMYETIPVTYTAVALDPSNYKSEDFCDVNIVLLVVP